MATRIFVAGKWEEARLETELKEPGTHEPIAHVGLADTDQAQRAAESLKEAFPEIRSIPAYRRSEILQRLAEKIREHGEELAHIIAREAGKPIKLAKGEVERALITTTWSAEEAHRWHGEMLHLDITPAHQGKWGIAFRVPVGPILAITPFNFPLNLILHKIGPAMAMGAPFMIKPAPQTPLTALRLTELLLEAGWPETGVAFCPCPNEVASKLVESDAFGVVSFTGSAPVGWAIKAKAGKKKVVLELGGNAGVIVDEETDVERAAQRCAFGAYVYAGQVCISVQRIYVHDKVWQPFLDAFRKAADQMKVGMVTDPEVTIGPMIKPAAAERVDQWVSDALKRGAQPILQGARKDDWVYPWALTRVPPDHPTACEEIFGPVAVLEPIRSFQEGIHRVNDSRYGLQAGIFTRNWERIQEAMHRIEVGGLIVNDIPTLRIDPMPYGGMKSSGYGREGIRYAMEAMSDIRMVLFCPESPNP